MLETLDVLFDVTQVLDPLLGLCQLVLDLAKLCLGGCQVPLQACVLSDELFNQLLLIEKLLVVERAQLLCVVTTAGLEREQSFGLLLEERLLSVLEIKHLGSVPLLRWRHLLDAALVRQQTRIVRALVRSQGRRTERV